MCEVVRISADDVFAGINPPVVSSCLLTLTPAEVVWTSSIPTITAQQLRLSRDSILSSSSSTL